MNAYRVDSPSCDPYVLFARNIQVASQFVRHWPHVTVRKLRLYNVIAEMPRQIGNRSPSNR